MPLQKTKDWAELSGQAVEKASQLVLPYVLVCSETLGSWVTAAAEAKGSLPCYSFMSLLPLVNSMVGSAISIANISAIIGLFTPHVPVFFWSSRHNLRDIELKFCFYHDFYTAN